MPRTDNDSNYKGFTSIVTFKVLDTITGHGRELPRRRHSMSSYAIAKDRRKASSYVPVQERPPLSRKRPLTPPPCGRAALEAGQFNEQFQSSLFTLPEELRLLIFEHVLGGNLFHIVRRTQQFNLGHILCKTNLPRCQDQCKETQCRGLKIPSGLHLKGGSVHGHADLIQLLVICRKIYIEASKLLYSSNIFDFDSMETLIMFCNSTVPARFDSIVSMQLDFSFFSSSYFSEATPQNDLARWERTWRIIGSMKALQFLWVRISWAKSQLMTVREERRYLEPLCQVRELNCFEVSLPPVVGTEFKKGDDDHWVVLRRKG